MDKQPSEPEQPKHSFMPSQYMRDRHPHLFSDSSNDFECGITREVLSYHLETLTNQKDESAFENFAHRLCEKFVAPNLRPQTGPTGGGDGKTDAETYPVAVEIALRWYVTEAAQPGERWAFAFSAKKDWRSKVRADVNSILSTNRNYNHIYFVTNQFAPAKDSASLQDWLQENCAIPVTILDRTWLLDRIFDHHSLDIAVEELSVGKGAEQEVKKVGPKDFERAAELDELEKALIDGSKYDAQPHALAEDSLRAAVLARGLEKPAEEVNGRFERAVRIAKDRGLHKHELAATYDWAWTSYFWQEGHAKTNALYEDIEHLALTSDEADDLERLTNVLPLIRMSVKTGNLSEADAKLDNRTADLMAALERVSTKTGRPNNALYAKALLLMTQMSERATKDQTDAMVDIWKDFRDVVVQAKGLGTFPFHSIANALTEVGLLVPESPEFDNLYEAITDALVARNSEGEAAKKNVVRAYQKLHKKLPYEAIRWFGRGVHLLIKEEYEEELINALIGSGFAYEAAGLYWAARNFTLAAVSQQFSTFARTSSLNAINLAILRRFFWLELKLGRIPQILNAHELGLIVRSARARTDQDRKKLVDAEMDHAGMLGALILKTPFDDLAEVTQFPDALERLALPMVRVAILFLMGHEDTLRVERYIPESETAENYRQFFDDWYAHGNEMGLPERPDYALGDTVVLKSIILGCDLEVTCANNLTSLGIGEALLGTLEALLATSLSHRMLPQLDHFSISVLPGDIQGLVPRLEFSEEHGEPIGTVTHPPQLTCKTREDALSFPSWLKDAALEIFLKFVAPADVENWSSALFKDESAFDRALAFSNIPIMLGNLFGEKDRLALEDWIEPDDCTYEIKRSVPWLPPQGEPEGTLGEATFGEGEPPEGFFDLERIKHSEIKVLSPIDVQKWDAAKWDAALFMFAPDAADYPPILGLAYKNREPAQAIFEGFLRRFGKDDKKNDLRIAIIRGISQKNPLAYGVIVGPNLDNIPKTSDVMFEFVSRMHRMYPSSPKNLDCFLEEFKKHGRYLLVPAHFPTRESQPEPMVDFALGKHNLTVREAWQIGENDPDIMILDPDNPPLIPPDQPDAPVLKAMKQLRRFHNA